MTAQTKKETPKDASLISADQTEQAIKHLSTVTPNRDNEILSQQVEHLKAHNSILRAQLGECLQQAGRCSTPNAANQ